ncbi:MAG: two-component system sensor histidine kinase NtrB, partial [Isosphaeraceae bacterium]
CSQPPMGLMAPVYDWRELQRWGISESLLPPGSTVLFRPPTLWEQYRWYVVAAATLLSVQTLLIVGLLIYRHRRARAESALVQSQRRLHLITDSLPALIAHVDRDQRYQFVNRAYERWFGLSPSQALGRTIREVLGEQLYRSVRPYVERALSGEQVSFTTEILGQGGQPRVVEATYVPDCEKQGDVRGFYALVLDVTDRNRAQHEARSLLNELAHANRISMMGELAATLAHELNQPMTAIMSNAQAATRFLDRSSPDLDEVREILREIAEEDARAGEVIRRMRTLVKKERASFQPLDLNEILHEVVWLLRNDAMIRKVGIELQLDPDLPAVGGDRIQLQQVVMNLLLNAFDAIGESWSENRTVLVETSQHDAEIQVTVRDSGAGITPDTLERLFQPFNTSKPNGLGMGLSISRSIVGLHGGRLWGENNSGPGAVFSFTLPVVQVPALAGGEK